VLTSISHARLRVHWAPGIPHALSLWAEEFMHNSGAFARREGGGVSQPSSRGAKRRSDPHFLICEMDCFAPLAMTLMDAHSRDPVARNDGSHRPLASASLWPTL